MTRKAQKIFRKVQQVTFGRTQLWEPRAVSTLEHLWPAPRGSLAYVKHQRQPYPGYRTSMHYPIETGFDQLVQWFHAKRTRARGLWQRFTFVLL